MDYQISNVDELECWTNMCVLKVSGNANIMVLKATQTSWSVGGVMVSIAAFQAVDLGSIPGQRTFFSFCIWLATN